jgi:hypothetical protein
MASVRAPPIDEAKSIFDDLGYRVSGNGQSFRATRDWKEVHVTAIGEVAPSSVRAAEQGEGGLQCFVAWQEHCSELASRLANALSGDWALIAVDEEGDYQVMHRSI